MIWQFLTDRLGSSAFLLVAGFVWIVVVGGMFLDEWIATRRRIRKAVQGWVRAEEPRRRSKTRRAS